MKIMHVEESTTEIENQFLNLKRRYACSYTILINAFIVLPIDHSYAEHTIKYLE